MLANDTMPSAITFSILIKMYSKAKNIDKAFDIYENEMPKYNVYPGLVTYTCLLQTCIHNKKCHKAIELFIKMKSEEIEGDQITYNTLINGCIKNRYYQDAYEISVESLDKNILL